MSATCGLLVAGIDDSQLEDFAMAHHRARAATSACDWHAVQVKASTSLYVKQLVDDAWDRDRSSGAATFNGTTLVQRCELLNMVVDAASRTRGDANALLI